MADAWLSAFGAVPKTDAEGHKSGARAINDLRPQNAHIAASGKEDEGTGREAPPQRSSSIVDLLRLVVRLALDNPGVDILVFKKDLESAFKLLHLNIAEAPWQVSELPIEGVPGLLGCKPVAASVAQIQRRGRWATECWRAYVWEGRERARDWVGRMMSSTFSLMASLAHYKRSA